MKIVGNCIVGFSSYDKGIYVYLVLGPCTAKSNKRSVGVGE